MERDRGDSWDSATQLGFRVTQVTRKSDLLRAAAHACAYVYICIRVYTKRCRSRPLYDQVTIKEQKLVMMVGIQEWP